MNYLDVYLIKYFNFHHKVEYLISWKGYDSDENSWEPTKNLNCPAKIAKFEALSTVKKPSRNNTKKSNRVAGNNKSRSAKKQEKVLNIIVITHIQIQFNNFL